MLARRKNRFVTATSLILLWSLLDFPAVAADVSGAWDLAMESAKDTGTALLVLRQEGERISGTYRGRMGDSRLEGTLKGDRISFTVTLKFQDQSILVIYAGSVDADTMKGTAQYGDSGSGSWSARRKH